jgi:cell division protein ZapE
VSLRLSELSAETTLPDFIPPPRFGETHFSDYKPQHPSQQLALEKTQAFIKAAQTPSSKWFWQKKEAGKGLYLDGGFGVGKTHLLASAFDAFECSKVYLSFAELVYVIGVLGRAKALEQLGQYKLYCIDEFELDDPGNTLIVKTFLSHVFTHGGYVITTSNTPPAAQGQGRFNANDFKREIQSIAERFEVLSIEGPDYRKRDNSSRLLSQEELEHDLLNHSIDRKVISNWDDFFIFLQKHHPIHYTSFLKQMDALYIEHAKVIPNQNDALRFVHFMDKLYDLNIALRTSGDIALEDLFDVSYRHGAFAKKHYRSLSRISELLDQAIHQLAVT